MKSEKYVPKSLTDKETKTLISRIQKESSGLRVQSGVTNGSNVVHVGVLGSNEDSRTITSESEWEIHPSNKSNSLTQTEIEQSGN